MNPFLASSSVYLLVRDSISRAEYFLGSNYMPPLAPPKGKLMTAHFKVIKQESASTSCKSIFMANLVPPFTGSL